MNVDRLIDRLLVVAAAGVCLLSALAAADDRLAFVSLDPVRVSFCSGPDTVPVSFTSSAKLEPVRRTYPIRSTWWTVNGTYPGRSEMIAHLQSGEHAGKYDPDWLSTLTRDELHSLHSDDHEQRSDRLATAAVAPNHDGSVSDSQQRRQIVIVTAPWCVACVRWARTEKPRLIKSGWRFNGPAAHFETVGSYPGVGSLPSFVLEIDGKAVKTLVGYQTAENLNALYREQR